MRSLQMTHSHTGDRWFRARRAVLNRDEVCQGCGSEDDLHVHHITPAREFDNIDEAHELDNLVLLCARCHNRWEGLEDRPHLLDKDAGLSREELVYNLVEDTITRISDPPGPWILFERFKNQIHSPSRVCDHCFTRLNKTRETSEYCESCGRPRTLWRYYNSAPDQEEMVERCATLAETLKSKGIPVDLSAMEHTIEKLWSNEEYYGRVHAVTLVAAKIGIKRGYSPDKVDVEYGRFSPHRNLNPT